jgi:hypothetical protein
MGKYRGFNMSSMGPSSIPGNTDQRPTHENKREIGAIMEHING